MFYLLFHFYYFSLVLVCFSWADGGGGFLEEVTHRFGLVCGEAAMGELE